VDNAIPEWMKPSNIKAIIDYRELENMPFILIREAGERLDSRVLSWFIIHALKNSLNLEWTSDGGTYWIGSPEFLSAREKLLPIIQ